MKKVFLCHTYDTIWVIDQVSHSPARFLGIFFLSKTISTDQV